MIRSLLGRLGRPATGSRRSGRIAQPDVGQMVLLPDALGRLRETYVIDLFVDPAGLPHYVLWFEHYRARRTLSWAEIERRLSGVPE